MAFLTWIVLIWNAAAQNYPNVLAGAERTVQNAASDEIRIGKEFQEMEEEEADQVDQDIDEFDDRLRSVEQESGEDQLENQQFTAHTRSNLGDIDRTSTEDLAATELYKSEAIGTAEDIETLMGETDEAHSADNDKNEETQVARGEYQTESVIDNWQTVEGNMDDAFGALDEEAQDDFKGLEKEMGEYTKEVSQVAKEQTEIQKDNKDELKQEESNLNAAHKTSSKEVNSIDGKVIDDSKEVEETGQQSEKDATRAASKALVVIGKDLDGQAKDAASETKELESTVEGKVDELNGEIESVEDEGKKAQTEVTTEAKQVQAASAKEYDRAEQALEKSEEEMDELSEDAKEMGSKQVEATTSMEGQMDVGFRNAKREIDDSKSTMQNEVGKDMEGTRQQILKTMKIEEQKIKTEAQQSASTMMANIKTEAKNVDKATADLGSATQDLDETTKMNEAIVKKEMAGLDGTKSNIEKEQQSIQKAIEAEGQQTLSDIDEEKSYVQGEVAAADHEVREAAGHASQKAQADFAKTEEAISRRISDFASKSEVSLTSAQRALVSTQRSAQDLVAEMASEATVIGDKKKEVDAQITPTTDFITSAETSIDKDVDGVENKIKETKQSVSQQLLEKQTETSDRFSQELENVEGGVRTQADDNEGAMERGLKGLDEDVTELRKGSENGFANADKLVAQLRQLLTQAQQRAKAVDSETASQKNNMEAALARTKTLMTTVDKETQRATADMQTSLESQMHDAVNKAAAKTADTIKQVMQEESNKLKGYVNSAQADIEKDEMAAKDYTQSSTDRLSKVSGDVENLGVMLQKNEMAAQQTKADLLSDIQSLMATQKQLALAAQHATEDEKEHLAKLSQELQERLKQKVSQIEATEHTAMGEMKKEVGSYYSTQKNALDVENGKVDASLNSNAQRVESQLKRVDDAVDKTHGYLNMFEQEENGAESNFQKSVSDLDKDIQISQDRLGEEVRNEDKSVADKMSDEISTVEGLVVDLQGVQRGSNTKIEDMKNAFKDELAYFASAGKSKSSELSQKLDHVEGSAVDLVAAFNSDTEASRNELNSIHGRLGKVVSSTGEQMEAFKQRLEEIRASRENNAIGLHDDISKVKSELTDLTGQTVDVIEEMKADTDKAYKRMAEEQNSFDRMLVNASQMSSSHDSGEIEQMTARMYDLESDHKRMMDWQKSFKHYDRSHNAEVERKLEELTGGIGSDEDQIAAGRLHSELSMQEGMRSLQRSVEGEVVDAVSKGSGAVGNLVNNIRNDMDQVFTDANHDEEAKTAEIMRAKNELSGVQTQLEKESHDIDTAGDVLQDKSNEFKNVMASVRDGISGELTLQQQTASEENQKRSQAISDLMSRISSLGGGSSFLQEAQGQHGSVVALNNELRALNDHLRRENTALETRDETLAGRIDEIKGKLEAYGVKI